MTAPVKPGTPLPWRTCEDPFDDQNHATGIETVTKNGLMGTPVANCAHDWEELRVSWKMATDNATYIVTACNAYPDHVALIAELVEALEDAQRYIFDEAEARDYDPPVPGRLVAKMGHALSKVKGEGK